ncbi:MAG: hypothetical protein PHE67_12300 [Campylobacterales bacterium]|jgi:hypothetical protein|nr:hypothetical protein [Campylobacterales bacterium]
MSDEAYESYVKKCAFYKVQPSTKEEIERHEEVCKIVDEVPPTHFISANKAKELVIRAYDMGYEEAMREIAS